MNDDWDDLAPSRGVLYGLAWSVALVWAPAGLIWWFA